MADAFDLDDDVSYGSDSDQESNSAEEIVEKTPKSILKKRDTPSKGGISFSKDLKKTKVFEKESSEDESDSEGEGQGQGPDSNESEESDGAEDDEVDEVGSDESASEGDIDDDGANSGDDSDDVPTGHRVPGQSFSKAFDSIMGKQADEKDPILSKSRSLERKIDEEKQAFRKQKQISALRKSASNKDHFVLKVPSNEHEKKLVKVATRGVVKLFNAITQSQKLVREEEQAGAKKGDVEHLTKNSFLDMIQRAPKSADDAAKPSSLKGDEAGGKKNWDVLSDNYGIPAKLKSWDQAESEDEEELPDMDESD